MSKIKLIFVNTDYPDNHARNGKLGSKTNPCTSLNNAFRLADRLGLKRGVKIVQMANRKRRLL